MYNIAIMWSHSHWQSEYSIYQFISILMIVYKSFICQCRFVLTIALTTGDSDYWHLW